MALFLSEANLSIGGRQLLWGQEYELSEGDPEVIACMDAGYLLPKGPDGSYSKVPPPATRRCCGG